VVLVPPSQTVSPTQGETAAGEVISQQESVSQQGAATPPAKRKTLFDLFKGGSSDAGSSAAPQAAEERQVASVDPVVTEPLPAPAPATKKTTAPQPEQQQASSGGGYIVQLASFRSEAEAQSEYGRIKSQYPDVVGGLAPRISQASLGGSTRYNLGLGPVGSREQASKVCNQLFSAGERDCLVRSQ
jgi:cell division protein FtsN